MQDKLFQCLRSFREHTGGVRSIAISPDGQTFVCVLSGSIQVGLEALQLVQMDKLW